MKQHVIKINKRGMLSFNIKDLYQNSYGFDIKVDTENYFNTDEYEYTLIMRTPSEKTKRFKLFKEKEVKEIDNIVTETDDNILTIEDDTEVNEDIINEEPPQETVENSTILIWPITLEVTEEKGWHGIQIEVKSDNQCYYTRTYSLFINESLL